MITNPCGLSYPSAEGAIVRNYSPPAPSIADKSATFTPLRGFIHALRAKIRKGCRQKVRFLPPRLLPQAPQFT
ncbi:MAG: hypothetical protein FWD49_05545 [Firmicutes bacterium]|nr:hypothetical protein [Bacillota bacterium]